MNKNLKLPSELLEPLILTGCLRNVSLFLKIKTYIDTNGKGNKSYFSDEKYQNIFNLFCKWFDKFKKFPSKKELKILIDRLNNDEEIKLLLNSIADKVYDYEEEITYEYLEEELVNFIKENRIYEAIATSQIDIENNNYGAIVNRMEEAVRVTFDKNLGISIRDIDQAFNEIRKLNEEECLETGYPNLDSILDGGLHPKELYCFASTPGVGKTLFLGNLGINQFLRGKKVLVYTFETSTERLSMRYFSNFANMNKKEIILDEEGAKQKIKAVTEMTEGDIIVKEYGANTVSSNDLMAHINDLWMYKKWKPDIVIADYILIMRTNDKRLSSESSYRYFKIVTEELRNIAKEVYIPVLSACQINREGMSERGGSKAIVTAKDISESRGIYDTADFFGIITQTAKDKEKNKFTVSVEKNRNDRTGIRIDFAVDYEHMKVQEEGIY